ncbi:phosphatase PAP2 family protein [Mesoplasma lactucae]|uniref:Phosphatidic acid phosphatase type 2/haloperoxidase domain-containing protein n=1 Tax=Mesoplasma lactucae ATCC 49193 TaxID=81460 RepID=A0A291IR65_9MOLU|nr:phosphatase PAP2 family protein [Mesoplasma lactucae]ATG97216.1 hypothetical protein CP520_00350 [Mesoplasma lactucae ATCC 49193]ATZ20342.1 hypothetical protein MLACT_v1c05210 [Mesoplasma lactucae ATCC 49193]MCL8216513.1 hypothetical protein [Mesoplasma lactucae ATCC 49193]
MSFELVKLKNENHHKDKIIFTSVIGIFIVLGIGSFIATSFYSVDYKFADTMYKSMKYKIFRGWEAYTIMDGNVGVITCLILMFLVLFESYVLFIARHHPGHWFAQWRNHRIWFYVVGFVVIVAIEVPVMMKVCFANYGFGKKFDWILLIGSDYQIPIFIVSLVLQWSFYWFMAYMMLTKIAKTDLFLDDHYWRRALILVVMLAFNYIIILIFKPGFGRVYYFNINWQTIFDSDFNLNAPENIARKAFYLNQTQFQYGYTFLDGNSDLLTSTPNKAIYNIPPEITQPWYKARGFFGSRYVGTRGTTIDGAYIPGDYGMLPKSDAFPSGHTAATIFIGSTIWVFAKPNLKIKKNRKYIYIAFVIAIIYLLDMMFALVSSSGHWWSDMAFQLFMMPVWFILAYLLCDKVLFKLCSWFGYNYVKKISYKDERDTVNKENKKAKKISK